MGVVIGLTGETLSLFSIEAVLLTLIWRTMMGHQLARESKEAPVLLNAGFGTDFRKGQ